MNDEENLMCPICGGLHPAGHRDKELERAIKGFWFWIKHKGKYFQDPIKGTGKHSEETIDVWLEKSLIDWASGTSDENEYLRDLLIQSSEGNMEAEECNT